MSSCCARLEAAGADFETVPRGWGRSASAWSVKSEQGGRSRGSEPETLHGSRCQSHPHRNVGSDVSHSATALYIVHFLAGVLGFRMQRDIFI